jgi:hypothetical protein
VVESTTTKQKEKKTSLKSANSAFKANSILLLTEAGEAEELKAKREKNDDQQVGNIIFYS